MPATMTQERMQGRASLFAVVGRQGERRETKTTQKGKMYYLMMPIYIYIYHRLRRAVAFNPAMTDRLPGSQTSRRFAL